MKDIQLALITGVDIPVEGSQLIIHQPKLKELALIGETTYFSALQYLAVDKNYLIEDKTLLEQVTNFQIFMKVMTDDLTKDKRKDVEQLFSLLFPNYKMAFLPSSIIMTNQGEKAVLDENNFQALQQIIAQIFCLKTSERDGFNPAGKKAEEIARKLMKARKRVAQDKGAENANTLSSYISSLAIGQGLSINDVSNYTVYQLYDALERYQLYVAWDLDIKSRLAGAKTEEKPENWLRNIH